jgi:hypothetical protein
MSRNIPLNAPVARRKVKTSKSRRTHAVSELEWIESEDRTILPQDTAEMSALSRLRSSSSASPTKRARLLSPERDSPFVEVTWDEDLGVQIDSDHPKARRTVASG